MSFCAFGLLLEKINVFLCLELTGIFCLETFKSDTPRCVYNEIIPSSQLFGVFMFPPLFSYPCLLPLCCSQHLAVAVVFSSVLQARLGGIGLPLRLHLLFVLFGMSFKALGADEGNGSNGSKWQIEELYTPGN